mgnify:CR=1 FL=1
MLTLAKQCKKLKIFTHISTAYVNCNRPGSVVQEMIYDENQETEQIVDNIMAMTDK